ncbi:hypothetical protein E4U19_000567, partial [Claviceps sp. Clav32 group G5]
MAVVVVVVVVVVLVVVVLVARRPVDDDPISQRGPSSASRGVRKEVEGSNLASASAERKREPKAYIREKQEEREEIHDRPEEDSLCRRLWRMTERLQAQAAWAVIHSGAERPKRLGHVDSSIKVEPDQDLHGIMDDKAPS